jgi:periplasmic divalent cation tolerance protein
LDEFILVLSTVPDRVVGQEIARVLLEERLAACVTISAACESFYWWEQKISQDQEYILFIKTRDKLYPNLEKRILELHPYDVPEIIALPLNKGLPKYLDWITDETK